MKENNEHSDHQAPDGKFVEGNQLYKNRKRHGRKSKLSRFIQAFASVLQQPHPVGHAIIYTDAELVFLANDRLEPEDRIDESAISRWKKFEFADEKDQAEAEEFRRLYEKHLLQQRSALFDAMVSEEETRSWNRYLAIIERKFDNWNLRQKQVDETPDLKKLVFRVEGE